MSKYPLPDKTHDVIADIEQLGRTYNAIDSDISTLEGNVAIIVNKANTLQGSTVYSSISDGELKNIAANRFITVNAQNDGFVCVDGGGAEGGTTSQCCVKRTNEDFDSIYGDILDVSRNGTLTQSNITESEAGDFVIIEDTSEITNEQQMPHAEPSISYTTLDYESLSNESVCLSDTIAQPHYETREIATALNYGVVKIGNGVTVDNGVISTPEIKKACKTRFGIMKPGSGISISDGIISSTEINRASNAQFGVVKLSDDFVVNENGAIELFKDDDMDAAIIYKLSQKKAMYNGIVELEEKTLIYRANVTSDIVFSFNLNFEPTDDFTFILEITSDSTHLITFSDPISPMGQTLPINRGLTKIYVTKHLAVPFYEVSIDTIGESREQLLTPTDGELNSSYMVTTPLGSQTLIRNIVRESYSGGAYIIPLIRFEFLSLVRVDSVGYWSYSSSTAINEFTVRASLDGVNWITIIHKVNEIVYGRIPTEIKGAFKYYEIEPKYQNDNVKPGGVSLYGESVDTLRKLGGAKITKLTPLMNATTTATCALTISNPESTFTASYLQDDDLANWVNPRYDENQERWIKYEFTTAQVANTLMLDITGQGDYTRHSLNARWVKLEGSNDDTDWTLLFEKNYPTAMFGVNKYNRLIEKFTNSTAYKYYKLTCLETVNVSGIWLNVGFMLYNIDTSTREMAVVPKLSSNAQDGYEVSASSQWDSGHAPWYAFDGNTQTRWASNTSGQSWLQVKLPYAVAAQKFLLSSRGESNLSQSPSHFIIQASNDGEAWDDLLEENTTWTSLGETQIFETNNETLYLYYRILILANAGHSQACALSRFNIISVEQNPTRKLEFYNYLVPTMSGDTLTNNDGTYRLSSSSEHSSNKRIYLFDHNVSTRFELSGENSGWVQVELPTAKIADILEVGARNDGYANAAPRNYELLGSNNGTTWTSLFSISDSSTFSTSEVRQHPLPGTTAYRFYRLNISNPGNSILTFAEWGLVEHVQITEYYS